MPEIEQEKEYLQEPLKPIKPEERAKIISDKTKTSNLEDDINILGGRYAVGYSSRAATTGTQAITGIGFTPKLIKIMAVYDGTIPGAWSNGRATSTTNEYCIYYRANGDTTYDYSIINVSGTDVNVAQISSFDADGFTLSWTTSNDTISFSYECYA